jgi:hypothetical protein
MLLSLLLASVQLPPISPFVAELKASVAAGNKVRLTKLFADSRDTDYLYRMAESRGGLRTLSVAVIPAPPGWEGTGKYWAVIHTRQDIEEDHDTVFPVRVSSERWKLGAEIPEDATSEVEIKDASLDVHLTPAAHLVDVHCAMALKVSAATRAPLFRLNDDFKIKAAHVTTTSSPALIQVTADIPVPKEGDLVHAGGLLIPWTKKIVANPTFDYTGTINTANEDKIDTRVCYLTAWWVPSLGRLPFTTSTRVVGPSEWVLESEGKRVDAEDSKVKPVFEPGAGEKAECFRCDIPISYPKVVGGKYIVAAEKRVGNRTYRAYHLDSTDNARAEKDVQTIADAIAWYEANLGPFPFDEYNCFDADTYYGIESYNYTLLSSRITDWAVGHEAGHTYFGGLVPCAYVHDSWNESMTQYVDSVLRQNDADQTLESAASTLNLAVPLTEMPVSHEYNSATYSRGAYVLRMLENEIGRPAMLAGIRAIIKDRVGKDTTWYSLRPYFEKASAKKLDWFWQQWISSGVFPKLSIVDAQGIPTAGGTQVKVTVRQTGTPNTYHLRFKVIARGLNKEVSQVVEMRSPEATFNLNLGGVKAYEAAIDVFSYAFCPKIPAAKVKL